MATWGWNKILEACWVGGNVIPFFLQKMLVNMVEIYTNINHDNKQTSGKPKIPQVQQILFYLYMLYLLGWY